MLRSPYAKNKMQYVKVVGYKLQVKTSIQYEQLGLPVLTE